MSHALTLAEEGYPQCIGCGEQLGPYWTDLPGAEETGQPWCAADGCYPKRRQRKARTSALARDPQRAMPAWVGPRQREVLRTLGRGDWLTSRQIADRLGITQHTAWQAIDGLLRREIIERRPALPGGRYGYQYHWTPRR